MADWIKPSIKGVEDAFEQLEKVAGEEPPFPKDTPWEARVGAWMKATEPHLIAATAMGSIFMLVGLAVKSIYLSASGWSLLVIVWATLSIFTLAIFPSRSVFIWKVMRNPHYPVFALAKARLEFNTKLLDSLMFCRKDELELALFTLKCEVQELRGRIDSVPGTALKTGLLPTIVAMLVTFSKVAGPLENWIVASSIGIVVLQMLGLYMIHAMHRLERVVSLAELALEKLGEA